MRDQTDIRQIPKVQTLQGVATLSRELGLINYLLPAEVYISELLATILDLLVHLTYSEEPDRYSTTTKIPARTGGGDPFKITWVNKLPITRRGIHIWVTGQNIGPIYSPFYIQRGTGRIFDKYQKSSPYRRWRPFQDNLVNKPHITRRGIHIWVTCQNFGPLGPFYIQLGTRQIFDKYQKSRSYRRWRPFQDNLG